LLNLAIAPPHLHRFWRNRPKSMEPSLRGSRHLHIKPASAIARTIRSFDRRWSG
jgi:hypothetical protein